MNRFLLILLFFFLIFRTYEIQACSAFFLCRDSIKILAKNHDFKTNKGFAVIHKKGIKKTADLFDKKGIKNIQPVKWTSKYDNITVHAEEKQGAYMPIDGMNSEGLAISELYVNDDETKNISFDNTNNALMCSIWVGYVLDNYKDVNEIIADITKLRLINTFHAHWFACDKSGNSAVIEYINGNLVINYGQPLSIPGMTNHPYVFSCLELNKYASKGHKHLPKGHKSIERFIRGYYKLSDYDGSDPVMYMLGVMKSVERPETTDSPTQWTTMYDLKNMKIYCKVRGQKKVYMFDFIKEIKKPNNTIMGKLKGYGKSG